MKTPLPCAALCALAHPVSAEAFRRASRTDPNTMDPHAGNSAPVPGFLNNVHEGRVRRGRDMATQPSLATAWAPIGDGAGWRFTLREGVTFHDGSRFTAEDVVVSYERACSPETDTASWFSGVTDVIAVDDHTVDILTNAPNPLFPCSIANWMMMDSGWAKASSVTRPNIDEGNFATLNTNGTGAYRVGARDPGLRTVLPAFEDWWGEDRGDVTAGIFTPIDNSATAVAALLSGDMDMINPVPVQDADRLDNAEGLKLVHGAAARVIMFGFSRNKDMLVGGDTDGNPFRDRGVRQGVTRATNVPAIAQTGMRGSAKPTAQLVSPAKRGHSDGLSERPALDIARARALPAEAGYPDGFLFLLTCPNDRYIDDEAVCRATVAMLAQIGLDAEPPFRFLVHTPQDTISTGDFGGHSNPRVDNLIPAVQSEIDDAARQTMLDEIAGIVQEDMVDLPLCAQPLLWAQPITSNSPSARTISASCAGQP